MGISFDMLHYAFLPAVLLLIVFAVWLLRRHSRLQGSHAGSAQVALEMCKTMLNLMSHIQQHRGMSTAWLAGDKSFERRLSAKRAEIEPLMVQLQRDAEQENKHSYPCFTPNDITLWRHRWGVLVNELSGYPVERSIAAHSNLIATLLNWLDAIGEARVELPMGALLPAGAVRNFAHRLPHLTECLGQARATGSGVAAKGACPAVARVRLMFLVSRAESLIDQACAVDKQGAAAALKVKALVQMIRTQILGGPQITVNAETYFAEATSAIDAVFNWGRECGSALEAMIAQAPGARTSAA